MCSKAHTALTAPLVLQLTRIYKRAMKKIIINGQMRNKPFFDCHLSFFTSKSRYEWSLMRNRPFFWQGCASAISTMVPRPSSAAPPAPGRETSQSGAVQRHRRRAADPQLSVVVDASASHVGVCLQQRLPAKKDWQTWDSSQRSLRLPSRSTLLLTESILPATPPSDISGTCWMAAVLSFSWTTSPPPRPWHW